MPEHRLRYALTWNHQLSRAMLGVFIRALLTFERSLTHVYTLSGITSARSLRSLDGVRLARSARLGAGNFCHKPHAIRYLPLGFRYVSSRARSSPLNSVHRPEVEIGGTLADFSTVISPFFDRFAEVEPNEDARIRILYRRLGEAGIRAEHW